MSKAKLSKKTLKKIYELTTKRDEYLYSMYRVLDEKDIEFKKTPECDFANSTLNLFAKKLNLTLNKEVGLALLNRLILLREDDIVKLFENDKKTEAEIIELRKIAYDFTEMFQMEIQSELINKIVDIKMPEFYKHLFSGIFKIGTTMNTLNKVWDDYLLNNVNPTLEKEVEGNVRDYLLEKNLMEKDTRTGTVADRSYSVLSKQENGEYISLPYSLAFPEEVKETVTAIYELTAKLIGENNKYHKKEYKKWIRYFLALKEAFEETNNDKLIEKWADVDRKWMKIDSPIQMGHPLEYYEDKYRNAVCMEMDLRIDDIEKSLNNQRVTSMKPMFEKLFDELTVNGTTEVIENIKKASIKNVEKVQIHIGKQLLYFGATLNGLSSAQIVPNDEIISEEEGKKIFAFAEKSVSLAKAKPHLKINTMILGEEVLSKYYELLYNRVEDYLEVYDITTIGHEYGHALFKNELSEVSMNDTGNYKNIEEFKASAGGLVAFFGNKEEEERLWLDVYINTIMRAIKLISWKKVSEVEPYYCEGLITLQLLFKAKSLVFENNELSIDLSEDAYLRFKKEYSNAYKELANHYLNLKDASLYLYDYCKRENGYMMPIENETKWFDKQANEFVTYYFDLQEKIGRDIDEEYQTKIKTTFLDK